MTDKKISQLTDLPAASVSPSSDVLAIVDADVTQTKKVTAKALVDGALNAGTANGVLYLDGSKAATSGSTLTFNGSTFDVTGEVEADTAHFGIGTGTGAVIADEVIVSGTGSTGLTLHSPDANNATLAFGSITDDDYAFVQGYYNGGSPFLRFSIQSGEKARITSTGLGIGNISPATALHVNSGATNEAARFESTDTEVTLELKDTTGTAKIKSRADFRFETGATPSEAMRITSSGEVYIAGTTDQGAYNLQCNGTGVWGAGAYVNGSDERIKENISPLASGLGVVKKLTPVTYRYKESWSKDQSTQTGFIAQELLTALGGEVYVDGVVQQNGSEGYYSVAYQNIIPILTKAIQELSAKNDALEARIAALEAK